jgi:hypothetical protein
MHDQPPTSPANDIGVDLGFFSETERSRAEISRLVRGRTSLARVNDGILPRLLEGKTSVGNFRPSPLNDLVSQGR